MKLHLFAGGGERQRDEDAQYATDSVYSDGTSLQIAAISGSPSAGYVATLSVGVSPWRRTRRRPFG